MERSPPGSPSAAESSDYEPSLAPAEEPYSPTDSGAEEDLDEEMGAGSLGAAELDWNEAPEQDSGAEGELPDPEAAFSPSPVADPEEDSGDSEDDEADSEEEPAPKRRRLRGKQYAPAYGPPRYPELLAELPGPKAAAKKKARKPFAGERCRGYNGEPCVFNPMEPGQPAGTRPKRGEERCMFCSGEKLRALLAGPTDGKVTQALKKIKAANEEIFNKAVGRIELFSDETTAKEFAKRGGAAKRQQRKPKPSSSWTDCLARRRLAGKGLSRKQRAAYKDAVEKDQRLARRKIFYPEKLLKRAGAAEEAEEKAAVAALGLESQVAFNDAELPAPKDPTAKMVEMWCKQGSWGSCVGCGSLRPRQLRPMDLKRAAKPTIPKSQCSACRSGAYIPQPEDIPEALRGLKPRVIEALRPLDIDTGRFERAPHGYRVHTAMISFAWAAQGVPEKIEALPKRRDRKKAKKALEHLLSAEESSYRTFIDEHETFLRKHGENAEEKRRKRPLRFIEREGLECCLWPHLYWHRNLCETAARESHPDRRARRRAAADSSSEDEEGADRGEGPRIEESAMGRVRQCFMRKVLSPVIGYGSDYQLLHFVYDLSMWTTVGAKKNIAAQFGAPLRLVLKNCSWTPEYWRVKHRAVIDMQRQCGNATLFRTRAPYEKTFPYHQAVLHEMEALGRPRLHLAGLETLRAAHVLLQMDKGFFSGGMFTADRADRRSENYIFAAEDPALRTVKARVTRLEFQDGKRKRGTQSYHGRGTTHSHSLDFLDNLEAIHLERKIRATVPDKEAEPFMHGVVMDSQRDYKDSKVPAREEPSVFDAKQQKVLLQHSEEDKALRIRAYFPATMQVTKCHEDVQQGDGNGAVLRYVATYNMKFSSSMDQDWLNDDASDFSVARRVLCCYQPLEPEMWLTLAGQEFPQVNFSGTLVDFMTPTPQTEELPAFVERYQGASWRREGMTLLEFARKSNSEGEIVRYIREHHKRYCMDQVRLQTGRSEKDFQKERARLLSGFQARLKAAKAAGDDPETLKNFLEEAGFADLTSLEDFANEYQTRGEKLIAAATHSMLNDRYYGQWLVLNVPFRRLQDFEAKAPEITEKIPARYRNFGLCMRYAPDHWGNDEVISEAMELEAHSAAHIETIHHKIRAQRHLVRRYLSGEINASDEVTVSDAEPAEARGGAEKLTPSQKRLVREMDKQLENALAAMKAEDEAGLEACVAAAGKHRMLFASGPPGTGKTFPVHEQVRKWQRKGARVLFTLPTGQLASEMRAVHPRIDVDTSHGAFRFHRDLQEAAGVLTQYDLSITDEVSMLTAEQYERIVALWKYAEQLPCVVLMGDFWQLPVVDKDAVRRERSPAWVYHVKTLPFHEQVRCKCPTLQRKLNALRTAVPSKKQLQGILRGHRAWKTNSPDGYDLLQTFRKHPNTTAVTCTRAASAHINSLAAKVFFEDRHKRPLGKAAFSYEANQDNFAECGGLKDGRLQAARATIYEGMRIFLTANTCKEDDFVNGMSAEIQDYDQRSQCLEVLTRTGKRLAIHIVTHELEDGRRVACFPARLGYACTVPKVQGMTLSHITLWLDRAGCRAAAYVALSRVQRDEDYAVAGTVSPAHFVPAQ